MAQRIFITGGAGFIGCHLTRALLSRGHKVCILDSLLEQVHGGRRPDVPEDAELLVGDIRDADLVRRALRGIDSVVHLAAEVGVGQSMYEIDRYVGANDQGTAVLLQALLANPVQRVVVASSMSIYGEGLYRTSDGRPVEDATRNTDASWDPVDADGTALTPVPTPETKRPSLASVYAISKYVQERLILTVTQAYDMQGIALRLFNVYGPGQALSNPYTGVLAIFASALLNGAVPRVFEDGAQRRDFVHINDVVRSFILALETTSVASGAFNVGSGESISVQRVAERLAAAMGRPDVTPIILGKARAGDIRHCFADISLARKALGYNPQTRLDAGMAELAAWVREQHATDRAGQAHRELEVRGLVA